jgi:hypothetical protein
MTSRNPITGDKIQTKVTTDEYRDNYDKIFNKPCCGGSTMCTAPCMKDTPKEKENDRQVQKSK